jgi:uncharacterized membrane protein
VKHCRTRRNDERGSILLLSTVGLVLALIAGSLAVDLGSIAQHARDDQRVADLAALDGVRALPGDPTAAAEASACLKARNDFPCSEPGYSVTVKWGDVVAGDFTDDPGTLATANAVQVTTTSPHTNAFGFLGGGKPVTRKAVATLGNGAGCALPDVCVVSDGSPIGTVRVGSTLASVDSTPRRSSSTGC